MKTHEPFDLTAAMNNAAGLYYARDFEAAMAQCDLVLAHIPDQPDALNVMALVLRATKKWGKAEETAKTALESHPNHQALLNTLGLIMLDQRRLAEAADVFERALELNPNKTDLRINLALIRHELGDLDAASTEFNAIIAAGTEMPNPYFLRSAIRTEQGDFESARQDLIDAEKRGAPPADIATGRAQSALASGDIETAYEQFDRAVAHAVDVPDARVNRGVVRLLQGRIADGWEDYSMRHLRRWGRSVVRPLPYPPWQGEPLAGKTILLWTEQGLGEAILGSTLVSDAISEAGGVILECTERLVALFQRSFPDADVKPQVSPPDPSIAEANPDYHASLLDLVRYRGDLSAVKPAQAPSLVADKEQSAALRSKYLRGGDGRLVGLSWSSPKALGARIKGVDVELWQSILSVPDVTFVNLQYGDERSALDEVARACGATLLTDNDIDLSGSLDEPAAQIGALDLVLTVSTTTAHLSGALGKESWVIVPPLGPAAMWYWFMDRPDSPWYAKAHLFRRQYGEGQDAALMDNIANKLQACVAESD